MGRSGALLFCAWLFAACQQEMQSPAKQLDAGLHGPSRREKSLAALDRLRVSLDATERKRSPLEAHPELTNAYVDLEFAVGYARLGADVRARALVAHALSVLDAKDPVHATLVAEFTARIDAALAGASASTPLTLELERQLLKLDHDERYKVDRLRESSQVLAPTEPVDAIGESIRDDVEDRLRGLTGDARATAIQASLDAAKSADCDRTRANLVIAALDASLALTPAQAAPILRSAIDRSATLPAALRAQVAAQAVIVAAHVKDATTATSLLVPLEALDADTDVKTIEGVIGAFGELRTPRALVGWLDTLERGLGPKNHAVLFALAGGWYVAGDKARARAILGGAAMAITRDEMLPHHLEVIRAIGFAYSNGPLEAAEPGISAAVTDFAHITDSYSTNTHYSLSVITDVESLVRAIAPPTPAPSA